MTSEELAAFLKEKDFELLSDRPPAEKNHYMTFGIVRECTILIDDLGRTWMARYPVTITEFTDIGFEYIDTSLVSESPMFH